MWKCPKCNATCENDDFDTCWECGEKRATGYYILEQEEAKGPFTIGQLRSMWSTGTITINTMHCQQGDEQWRPLTSILHLLETTPNVAPSPIVVVRATKSRGVYIILGLFFGCLGIHNFYAGHYGRGAAQLVITILLGWAIIGLVITVFWSLIEIISETQDGDGQRMT
jgi:TM2 domain-containing membrane protein YozV